MRVYNLHKSFLCRNMVAMTARVNSLAVCILAGVKTANREELSW